MAWWRRPLIVFLYCSLSNASPLSSRLHFTSMHCRAKALITTGRRSVRKTLRNTAVRRPLRGLARMRRHDAFHQPSGGVFQGGLGRGGIFSWTTNRIKKRGRPDEVHPGYEMAAVTRHQRYPGFDRTLSHAVFGKRLQIFSQNGSFEHTLLKVLKHRGAGHVSTDYGIPQAG